jgi:hypothetical protein
VLHGIPADIGIPIQVVWIAGLRYNGIGTEESAGSGYILAPSRMMLSEDYSSTVASATPIRSAVPQPREDLRPNAGGVLRHKSKADQPGPPEQVPKNELKLTTDFQVASTSLSPNLVFLRATDH